MRLPGLDPRRGLQFSVVAAVSAFVIAAAARRHPWNSDDVALQVAMRTWSPGNGTLYLPEGTWLLRVPLYAVTEWMFGSTTTTLAVQTVVLNVLAAVTILWFIRLTISLATANRPEGHPAWENDWIAVLVTCWVITVSPVVVDIMLRPGTRNLENGLVCIGLVLAANRLSPLHPDAKPRSRWSHVRPFLIPAAWFGVLAIHDPIVMYCLVGPAAVLAGMVLVFRRSKIAVNVMIIAIGGIAIWRIGLIALRAIGVETVSLNSRVIEAAEFPSTLATTADSMARIFSVPVFGAAPNELRLAVVGPQLAVLALTAITVWRLTRTFWRNPVAAGAALWVISLIGAFMLSSHGLSDVNIRYLVFTVVPIAGIGAAGIGAAHARPRRLIVAMMTIVLAVHVLDAARSFGTDVSPNTDAARVVEALAAADVQRGYGDFWETLGPSYFDRSLTLVPVTCINGTRTAPRHWFVHDGISRPDHGAARTAFIINDRPGLMPCGREQLMQQFGEPAETVQVTSLITLLIYEGDIGSDMDSAPPPG